MRIYPQDNAVIFEGLTVIPKGTFYIDYDPNNEDNVIFKYTETQENILIRDRGTIFYGSVQQQNGNAFTSVDELINFYTPFFNRGSGGGSGAVDDVFGRTGSVSAESGDYNADQITNTANRNLDDLLHTDIANEFDNITEKTSLADDDFILIEDSADSNNKKKVRGSNLPSGGGSSLIDYSRAIGVSSNGDDTNDGDNLAELVATFSRAKTLADAITGTGRKTIYCPDSSEFTESITTVSDGTDYYCPLATLTGNLNTSNPSDNSYNFRELVGNISIFGNSSLTLGEYSGGIITIQDDVTLNTTIKIDRIKTGGSISIDSGATGLVFVQIGEIPSGFVQPLIPDGLIVIGYIGDVVYNNTSIPITQDLDLRTQTAWETYRSRTLTFPNTSGGVSIYFPDMTQPWVQDGDRIQLEMATTGNAIVDVFSASYFDGSITPNQIFLGTGEFFRMSGSDVFVIEKAQSDVVWSRIQLGSAGTQDVTDTRPTITSFTIENQPNRVNDGTTLSGTRTFDFHVSNAVNVQGNLTLRQGNDVLNNAVNPTSGTVTETINSVTLNAGDTVTFTLSGTDTSSNAFSRSRTILGLQPHSFLYWNTQATNDASLFNTATAQHQELDNLTINIASFTGNQHIVIIQPNSEPDFTAIRTAQGGLNQISAYTITRNALTVNSVSFDAWVTNSLQVGSVLSNTNLYLER